MAKDRLSRLESGEIHLTIDEAESIARKIGETYPPANLFAEYLRWEWKVIQRPGFDHISLKALWNAESTLQQLDVLIDDPEVKNSFVRQLQSFRNGLFDAAAFLHDLEHGIAFIGPPKAGKTTTICALGNLRDSSQKGLGDQMALQTGGGRVTVCEGHLRGGDEFSIVVDSCTHEEIRQFVAESAMTLWQIKRKTQIALLIPPGCPQRLRGSSEIWRICLDRAVKKVRMENFQRRKIRQSHLRADYQRTTFLSKS